MNRTILLEDPAVITKTDAPADSKSPFARFTNQTSVRSCLLSNPHAAMRRSAGLVAAAATTTAAVGVLAVYYYHRRNIETQTEDDVVTSTKTERTLAKESTRVATIEAVSMNVSSEPMAGLSNHSKSTTGATNNATTNKNDPQPPQQHMRKCDTAPANGAEGKIAKPEHQRNIRIKASTDYRYASKVEFGSTISHGKQQSHPLTNNFVGEKSRFPTKEKLSQISKAEIEWLASVETPACLVFAEQDEPTVASTAETPAPKKRWRFGGVKKRMRSLRGRINHRNWSFRPKRTQRHRTAEQDVSEFFV